jgi:hypothetical protein
VTTAPITTPTGTSDPFSTPGTVSPVDRAPTVVPTTIATVAPPTFGGRRYVIGDPGSFIGTRFGSGGTPTPTGGPGGVTTIEATLKPGSRAYGIIPPKGQFIRWYPEARWKAGLR